MRRARAGFTLLEVALAVVMGLVILFGAYYGYQINKEQAGNAAARRRLIDAQVTVEAYAAANQNSFPVSGQNRFADAWAAAHPEERGVSPWGGATGDEQLGACEDPPITDGSVGKADAPDQTDFLSPDGARQSNLHYVSIEGNRWVRVDTRYDGETKRLKGYVLSLYDGQGRPWFDAIGAK